MKDSEDIDEGEVIRDNTFERNSSMTDLVKDNVLIGGQFLLISV